MSRRRLIGAVLVAAAAVAVALLIWQRRDRDSSGDGSEGVASRQSKDVPPDALYIVEASARPQHVIMGEKTTLTVVAAQGRDRTGALRYSWHGGGTFATSDAAETTWTAPYKVGNYNIKVVVADAQGKAEAKLRISVRVPSPRDDITLAEVMRRAAADRQRKLQVEHAQADKRLAELRTQLAKDKHSVEDHLRAQLALEEMGRILRQLGRYEEALAVFKELRGGVLNTDKKYKKYSASLGEMHFFLGNDKEALEAFVAAGPYCYGTNRYYMAELMERKGDTAGAIASYEKATKGSPWFDDPVYRKALLSLEDGASAEDVAQYLVDASPRLDKDRMLERLKTDDELTPLMDALHKTSRVGDLLPQQPLAVQTTTPGGGPPALPSLNSPSGSSGSVGSSTSSSPPSAPAITATPVPGTGATAP